MLTACAGLTRSGFAASLRSEAAGPGRPRCAQLLRQPLLLRRILRPASPRASATAPESQPRFPRALARSSHIITGRKSFHVAKTTSSPSCSVLTRRMRSPVAVNASRTADESGAFAAPRAHASPTAASSCEAPRQPPRQASLRRHASRLLQRGAGIEGKGCAGRGWPFLVLLLGGGREGGDVVRAQTQHARRHRRLLAAARRARARPARRRR